MLHNEKGTFEQLILRTSEYLGVKAEIVEKDYFVTLFLKKIADVMPDIVFKGGTSLSKCYHKLATMRRFVHYAKQDNTQIYDNYTILFC